jgi:hypothetical protein
MNYNSKYYLEISTVYMFFIVTNYSLTHVYINVLKFVFIIHIIILSHVWVTNRWSLHW